MQSIMKNIAPPYDNSPCTKGEYRVVDDKIYLCKEDTSGVFDISKWEQVFLTDFIRGQLNENVESNLGGVVKSFTPSTSVSTKVTLGHKPNKLIIWGIINSEYQLVHRYDASVSTTQYNRYITDGSIEIETLPNSDKNRISSIDNDGFTFSSVSQSGTLYYMEV